METKKHLDCKWLCEIKQNIFVCCDSRSENRGKELTLEQVCRQGCHLFHTKDKMNYFRNSYYGDLKPCLVEVGVDQNRVSF